jgi:hypothetical protein
VISLRPGNLLWLLGLAGGTCVLLHVGNLPGDLGHTLFGDALCGPWG